LPPINRKRRKASRVAGHEARSRKAESGLRGRGQSAMFFP
jgi:hypothetical protein